MFLGTIAQMIERKKQAPEARKQRIAPEKLKLIPKDHFYFRASPTCSNHVNLLTGEVGAVELGALDPMHI